MSGPDLNPFQRRNHLAGSSVVRDALLKKLTDQGGIVIGAHGTSGQNAQQIMVEGFKDHKCIEGGHGVYFWDEAFEDNAHGSARAKATETGDPNGAIITAILRNPITDQLYDRPLWLVSAKDILEIVSVGYFAL